MKICVLESDPEGCEYTNDSRDISQHLRRAGSTFAAHDVDSVVLTPQNYLRTLLDLHRRFLDGDIDVFFNLCDGAWDEPKCGVQVVQLLEHKLGVPFTGAGTRFYEPTRLEMKKVALGVGVDVPPWEFVYSEKELDDLIQRMDVDVDMDGNRKAPLMFPLITKHFSSYSSVGLTPASKVWNVDDLRIQALKMIQSYGGCLIEEFITGREFTVLAAQVPVSGGDSNDFDDQDIQYMAYDAIECRFSQGNDFKHYELKWLDYDNISWMPVQDHDLNVRLKKLAVDVFRAMPGARGFGRLDIRSDPDAQHLYLLEINPNCGLGYPQGMYGSADFILDRANPKTGHAEFIINQCNVARILWSKQELSEGSCALHPIINNSNNNSIDSPMLCRKLFKPVVSRYDFQNKSWGLYTIRDIQQGEVIQHNEEAAVTLVSKAHVLRTWDDVPASALQEAETSLGIRLKTEENGATEGLKKNTRELHKKPTLGSKRRLAFATWDNFAAYCWPVSDNWFVTWNPDPNEWQPLNHSCDPNTWFEDGNGLNLVARRHIKAGEQVTADYVTFVGHFPEMRSFDCRCGSADCRKIVTGMDIVHHPYLASKYKGHMTDYIASKAKMVHGDLNGNHNGHFNGHVNGNVNAYLNGDHANVHLHRTDHLQ